MSDQQAPTADDITQRMIDRTHPALLALGSVLVVVGILGGFAAYLLSSAAAQTTQQLEPVKVRQTFAEQEISAVKATVVFMASEQREAREETRQVLKQVAILTGERPQLRPMAKLPIADGGP